MNSKEYEFVPLFPTHRSAGKIPIALLCCTRGTHQAIDISQTNAWVNLGGQSGFAIAQ
jgi:hypothetical protein